MFDFALNEKDWYPRRNNDWHKGKIELFVARMTHLHVKLLIALVLGHAPLITMLVTMVVLIASLLERKVIK